MVASSFWARRGVLLRDAGLPAISCICRLEWRLCVALRLWGDDAVVPGVADEVVLTTKATPGAVRDA